MTRWPLDVTIGAALCCVGASLVSAQNAPGPAAPNLLEGAVPVYSTDDGTTFTADAPVILPRTQATVLIELVFVVPARVHALTVTGSYTSLEFRHDVRNPLRGLRVALNGQEIPPPLEGMTFSRLPGIDPVLLRDSGNVLQVELRVWNGSRQDTIVFAPAVSLVPRRSSELAFRIGPLLGAFDEDSFTLTSHTNMPARMSVYRRGDGQSRDDGAVMRRVGFTEPGLIHRMRVARQSLEDPGSYVVLAERDGFSVGATARAPVIPEELIRFIVVGDSRTNVATWQAIAAAVAEYSPDLVIHVGDLVTSGRRDWEWDTEFWHPAPGLLGSVPFYPVIGNHEGNAPLYDELFAGPSGDGGARNWAQPFGEVLLIGTDGGQDWSVESENAKWLDDTLARSDAMFTFLFTHYPGWSSAGHGRLGDDGHPVERAARETRETVMPILSRHGGTAIVAGHDHTYERSELPDSVTAITCGGGGAGLYPKTKEAERQNPYSVVFAGRHHFCVFEVRGEAVTMRALSPDAELIDERTWVHRND
jgi:hypothetical protein